MVVRLSDSAARAWRFPPEISSDGTLLFVTPHLSIHVIFPLYHLKSVENVRRSTSIRFSLETSIRFSLETLTCISDSSDFIQPS
jgi:hypothetical protein